MPEEPSLFANERGTPDGGPPPTPVWVKVFVAIAIILVLAFVVSHLAGGGMGRHGP